MPWTPLRRALASASLGLLGACSALGDAQETLKQVFALQAQLQQEFPGEAITVTVSTGGVISVGLTNSRLAALPDDERAAATRRIATFVRQKYPRADQLQSIDIVFKAESGAGGLTLSRTQTTSDAISDLDAPPPPVEATRDSAPLASTPTAGAATPTADTTTPAAAPSGIKTISRWNSR